MYLQRTLRSLRHFAILFSLALALCSINCFADPFKTIDVDLASGLLKSELPFDVPFVLRGIAPQQLLKVDLWYKSRDCLVSAEFDSASWSHIQQPWQRRTSAWSDSSFYLLMPPLDANRYYQLKFDFTSSISQTELDRFKKLAYTNLDQWMRDSLTDDALTRLPTIQSLQAKILKSIQVSVPGFVSFAKGSLFDTAALKDIDSPAAIEVKGLGLDLLQVHSRITNVKDDLMANGEAGEISEFFSALAQLKKSAYLQKISVAKLTSETQDIQRAQKLASSFIRLDSSTLSLIASGILQLDENQKGKPGQAALLLKEAWEPEKVDKYSANLNTTYQAIRSMAELTNTPGKEVGNKHDLGEFTATLSDCVDRINSIASSYRRLSEQLTERNNQLAQIVEALSVRALYTVSVVGSSGGSYDTRANWYLSVDAGILYATRIRQFLPYAGVNIYLAPVNKEAPLNSRDSFGRRFAILVGITLGSVKKEGVRDDLFAGRALVVGLGLRISDHVRGCGGLLIFDADDPNPLITRLHPAANAFFSLSLDWDIASTLKLFGRVITGN